MRIAVCDGTGAGPSLLEGEIRALAAEVGAEVFVSTFISFRFLSAAVWQENFDLLILGAEVAGESGIDFARKLRLADDCCDIIFVAESADYALAAYSVFPTGYILLPATRKKLRPVFRRAAKRFSSRRRLLLRTEEGERISIPVDSIVYIVVSGSDLLIHCGMRTYSATGALSDVCTHLPSDEFYRSHRSFVVNMNHAVRLSEYFFEMDTGEKVSVAKNRYAEAKQVMRAFAGTGPPGRTKTN